MTVPAPKGLDKRGRRFWRDVLRSYELQADELLVLESASKTLDLIARIEEELADSPLTVKGSMGQQREHPLLSEVRQQRALLAQHVRQLALPDVDNLTNIARGQARSTAGRALASARWSTG